MPDAALLFITHILGTLEIDTINMRLLNGPLTLMAYALDFHSDYIICPFIACHGPTIVTALMTRLASSKLTCELGNIKDRKLDKHIQGNMAESSFVLCIKILEICIRMRGLPCVVQILQGRLLPTCFKAALFLGHRSRILCSALFRRIATFSIYPKVMHLVIKSDRHLETHGLKALAKSTVLELWTSWNILYDTVVERHTTKPSYSVLPRKLCNNPQCPNPYIRPVDAKRCKGCLYVHYCSRECQKDHWTSHRQKSGELMRVDTLYQDFAEWMVDLDLPRFLADTKEIRQRLEEKRAMTEPYNKYPMVVEDIARTTGIGRMPEVMTILNEVFFYAALPVW
ncbi:hypothetical protein IW261DRAFT_1504190 [Armillaria novae-zelandiae]|uniref:MYND-type domain-containing protein n=1 Tax=Armillaria novae-zelandiae TaxID=153914 RepID=A0AA39NWX6_9AGAR|nr:hypothetical protein IW261DRAFT_1504190 [Armillaria novae-zelandiae]